MILSEQSGGTDVESNRVLHIMTLSFALWRGRTDVLPKRIWTHEDVAGDLYTGITVDWP